MLGDGYANGFDLRQAQAIKIPEKRKKSSWNDRGPRVFKLTGSGVGLPMT
jgi:hypothetical protein